MGLETIDITKHKKMHNKKRNKKNSKNNRKNSQLLKIADKHIKSLFNLAINPSVKSQKLRNRYIHLARLISMKFQIKLNSGHKRVFCKHCYHALIPGKNLRVRVHNHKLIYYCLDCKQFWRKPLHTKE